jgi:hypothetical protein
VSLREFFLSSSALCLVQAGITSLWSDRSTRYLAVFCNDDHLLPSTCTDHQ